MRNMIILAGAAALAMSAAAVAKPGGGNGGGGPKQNGGQAKVEHAGGGGPKADRGGGPQMQRGGGGPQRAQQQVRGPEKRQAQVERRAERAQPKADRGPMRDVGQREARRDDQRGNGRAQEVRVREARGNGNDNRVIREVRGQDNVAFREVRADRGRDYFASPAFRTTGLIDGCPPGLAAKNNGCLPPGQAKKLVGIAAPAALGSALLPPLYRSWYPDNDDYFYRTEDGYVYRIDRDRNYVDAYWPLANDWTGAYYVGAAYPQDYLGYYNVPVQYQPWYADSDDYYYRYGDGAIYQVDRNGGLIEGIVSLLAGGFALNQPLPAGYDVYNVPYAYRDRYADTPDAWYRYNDGYIYQVDPTTRLVQAIVETLV